VKSQTEEAKNRGKPLVITRKLTNLNPPVESSLSYASELVSIVSTPPNFLLFPSHPNSNFWPRHDLFFAKA
jgi:hypothetical protein